jgi:hypothetical protein
LTKAAIIAKIKELDSTDPAFTPKKCLAGFIWMIERSSFAWRLELLSLFISSCIRFYGFKVSLALHNITFFQIKTTGK